MPCAFHALSDTGRVRQQNEDSVAVVPEAGLAVLADGMGGYKAGEVASRMTTQLIAHQLGGWLLSPDASPQALTQALLDSIQGANRSVFQAACQQADYQGMGTTLVVAVFQGATLTVAHVGDSRLYRLRQGQLSPLTRDHSWLQQQIDAGLIDPSTAHLSLHRNLVTRAVGVGPQVQVDVAQIDALPGDTYLLCSDGLHDMLSTEQLTAILLREPQGLRAAQALLDAANAAGGLDNISLVLVQCQASH
jgi:PPM family protein phosphatase